MIHVKKGYSKTNSSMYINKSVVFCFIQITVVVPSPWISDCGKHFLVPSRKESRYMTAKKMQDFWDEGPPKNSWLEFDVARYPLRKGCE
jgi:hypothetical protein